jgi:RNAse (barnase) inhibitor barstar
MTVEILLLAEPADSLQAWALSRCGDVSACRVVVIRGSRSETISAFYSEVSAALQFPDYFRDNLDSLDECLSDLSWIQARRLVIVLSSVERLLSKEDDPMASRALLSIIVSAIGDHDHVRQWVALPEQIALGIHSDRVPASDVFTRLGIDALASRVGSIDVEISEVGTGID